MNPLFNRLLSGLDVKVDAFGYCEIHHDWALAFPAAPDPYVHYCLSGTGRLVLRGHEPIAVQPETCVFVPPGIAGAFHGSPDPRRLADASLVRLAEPPALQRVRAGEGSPNPLIIACGRVMVDSAGQRLLLEPVRRAITSKDIEQPLARGVIDQLIAELSAPREGSRAIVETMLKLCLLLLLRMQFEAGNYPLWALRTAETKSLEDALVSMIEMPEHEHSIEDLASTSAMSRSRFLKVFSEIMDATPGEFLRDLRLAKAARLLTLTQRPVGQVALDVGYDSRSHFSRLFRDRYGADPTEYRRRVADRSTAKVG